MVCKIHSIRNRRLIPKLDKTRMADIHQDPNQIKGIKIISFSNKLWQPGGDPVSVESGEYPEYITHTMFVARHFTTYSPSACYDTLLVPPPETADLDALDSSESHPKGLAHSRPPRGIHPELRRSNTPDSFARFGTQPLLKRPLVR